MKRKIIMFIGIFLAGLVILGVAFFARMVQMNNQLNEGYESISSIDISKKSDGTYTGSFKDFLVAVDLEVKIEGGKIKEILVTHQSSGPGYQARETLDRILKAQTPKVEVVSGASGSSKALMIAVYRALR
ncbi:MAG: FMN-binding protein [Spirochaetales bacterium]